MTALTPQQMRELADSAPLSGELLHYLADVRAALRDAADQIEAHAAFDALRSIGAVR